MTAMRNAEDRVLSAALKTFADKAESFSRIIENSSPEEYLQNQIDGSASPESSAASSTRKLDSAACLQAQIRDIPSDKVPVILLGGSFNSSRHDTRVKEPLVELLRELTSRLNPDMVCFVIGNRLTGYERELVEMVKGRFEVYAIVPTVITSTEARRIKRSGAGVRVSIEPTHMGLYKSFAYEIFKRRPSVVLALDGNSAGANTIQEAKNGKRKAWVFVYRRARVLNVKAQALQGYVSVFDGAEAADKIVRAVQKVWEEQCSHS